MSDSDSVLISASAEFIALCQTQIILLCQSLGALESAVYLTQSNQIDETKLIPIVIYPPSEDFNQQPITLPLLLDNNSIIQSSSCPLLPINSDAIEVSYQNTTNTEEKQQFWSPKYQLLVPLVYEDLVIGLLATKRLHKEWNEQEFFQVEQIASTIALARILDQKQILSQQQLQQQITLNQLENNNLDDFLHQLRNPLTALRTFAKLLLKKLPSKDPNYKITENIIQQSDRLKNLIEYFNENRLIMDNQPIVIDYQQTSSNFLLPGDFCQLEKLNILDIIEPLLIANQAIALEKNINFTANIFNDLPLVLSNAKALTEVLNNLIDNALKYTPSNGKIVVEIGQQKLIENKNMLAIKISDTGYGIPLEDQQHIFKRHYRGIQAKSDIFGTGLGLAIVKDLCDKMQAKIELFSPSLISNKKSLVGTTFIVWLPIKE